MLKKKIICLKNFIFQPDARWQTANKDVHDLYKSQAVFANY